MCSIGFIFQIILAMITYNVCMRACYVTKIIAMMKFDLVKMQGCGIVEVFKLILKF